MRVKRGQTKRAAHKRVLAKAKGYRLSYSKLYRRAKEATLHAGQYSFAHRRKRPGQFRKIWIQNLNAICRQNKTTYSRFIHQLKAANVQLDRKVLSFLAYNHPFAVEKLIQDISK
jgi:large subunit ribosomal protein L20